MKSFLAAAAITVMTGVLGHGAMAQSMPAGGKLTPAPLQLQPRNNPGAPAVGANSFTEGQAKSRIANAGYTNIAGLIKDKDGIWRAKANNGSATVPGGARLSRERRPEVNLS